MSLFNKLTILSIFILMAAFVALPVMAHQLPAAPTSATQEEKDDVDDHNNDPHNPDDTAVSDPHALVESIEVSQMYLTTTAPITATITLADGVAAIANDPDTDDNPADPDAGDDNEARHGTLNDSGAVLAIADISIQIGTMDDDGEYTYDAAADATNGPQVTNVIRTRVPGTEDTGIGAVYTVYFSVPTTLADAVDGMYKISISKADVFQPDTATATDTFMMDTKNPLVSNVMDRPIGTAYKNTNNQWEDPFELTFDVGIADPTDTDPDDGTDLLTDDSLDVTMFSFEAKVGTEVSTTVSFGDVRRLNDKTFVVKVTPAPVSTTETLPTEVVINITAKDKAGNEGMGMTTVTLAPRTASTVGPVDPTVDTEKPTVVSIMAPEAPIAAGQANAGSLVFTITFSEPLLDDTFTLTDLVITNVDTQTAHSMLVMDAIDPKIYKLTVTPIDATFPVKVSFHSEAKVTDRASNVSVTGIDKTATYTPAGVLGVEIVVPDKPLNGFLEFEFKFAHAPFPAIDANGKEDIRGFTIGDVRASNAAPLTELDLRKSVTTEIEEKDKIYYLTVKPLNPREAVTVTLLADAVVANLAADGEAEDLVIAGQVSATFMPDIVAPILAITHTPADGVAVVSGGMVTFTFTFTDENTIETSGSGAFTTGDVTVRGGTKGTFTETNNKTYTLTVTPTTPNTNVTVTVRARSVMDTAIPPNTIAASVSATWTAPTVAGPDPTAPIVTITHSPADYRSPADPDVNLLDMTTPTLGNNDLITFTVTSNKPLGTTGGAELSSGDIKLENGDISDFGAGGEPNQWIVKVKPIDPARDVKLTVPADAVADANGNENVEKSEVFEVERLKLTILTPKRPGVLPPEVMDPDGVPTKLKFTIISNKALKATGSDSLTDSLTINDIDIDTREVEPLNIGDFVGDDAARLAKVKMDYGQHTVVESYTLTTTPRSLTTPVRVEVRAGAAKPTGALTRPLRTPGAEATYTPESGNPTIEISANPTLIDSIGGAWVTIKAKDNVRLKRGQKIDRNEVSIVGGDDVAIISDFTSTAADASTQATFKVSPRIGVMTLQIKVSEGAVEDDAGNKNVFQMDPKEYANPKKFDVGPIFTIPKNTIMVITKSGVGFATYDYLSDQPRLPINEDSPLPAPNIMVTQWGNMPDLEVLFNLYSRGGTVSMALHPTDANYDKAKHEAKKVRDEVRISEVMWASDLSIRGGVSNDPEAAEQWIEIENYGQDAAKVFLYARTAQSSAETHNSERFNKDNNLSGYFDRIGNAYNNSPGSEEWKVPGQNGNSYTGLEDFISMYRDFNKRNNTNHERYKSGTHKDSWMVSDREYARKQSRAPNTDNEYKHIGSPGRLHSYEFTNPPLKLATTAIPGSSVGESEKVLINEVGNRRDARYEWIELRNYGSQEADLRNFRISMVTAVGTETELFRFAHNDVARIPVGGVLLLVATDPRYDDDHPIAVGYNIDKGVHDQVAGLGLIVKDADGNSRRAPANYKVVNNFGSNGLPDSGEFVLIVRSPDNHENNGEGGKGWAELANNNDNANDDDLDKISDIAGYHPNLVKDNYPATTPVLNNTTLWPLVNFNGDMKPREENRNNRTNRLEAGKVRYRQHPNTSAKNNADGGTPGNRAGTGVTHKDEKVEHYAFRDAGYTGIGYKRTARRNLRVHNGTPGYHGNEVNTKATSSVTISEVMYSTGANGTLPQWIELYNSSATKVVNIGSGWRIMIETLDADGNALTNLLTIHFGQKGRVKHIYPQQTVLVAAGNARQAGSDFQSASVVFAENRLFNVYRDIGAGELKSGTEFANDRYMFFNPKAFHIALLDKDGAVVDGVGNLDGDSRTNDTVTPDQEFPSAVSEEGVRTSIIRIYDDGVARTGSNVVPIAVIGEGMRTDHDGIDPKYAWIPAVNTGTEFKITIKSTWYGDEDDYGTPGHRRGLVLPVELSSFRPTLEDGIVTIRWTTESELDNAGFNIYRSEERDGEFTQVNSELIDGAGTTGERTVYSWVDQTAKPGVVYYYQIEDVSFAGEREPLAVTKLKGLISAKNKLTTTWSELKEASQ